MTTFNTTYKTNGAKADKGCDYIPNGLGMIGS